MLCRMRQMSATIKFKNIGAIFCVFYGMPDVCFVEKVEKEKKLIDWNIMLGMNILLFIQFYKFLYLLSSPFIYYFLFINMK